MVVLLADFAFIFWVSTICLKYKAYIDIHISIKRNVPCTPIKLVTICKQTDLYQNAGDGMLNYWPITGTPVPA